MKHFKLLFLLIAALSVVSFSSCEKQDGLTIDVNIGEYPINFNCEEADGGILPDKRLSTKGNEDSIVSFIGYNTIDYTNIPQLEKYKDDNIEFKINRVSIKTLESISISGLKSFTISYTRTGENLNLDQISFTEEDCKNLLTSRYTSDTLNTFVENLFNEMQKGEIHISVYGTAIKNSNSKISCSFEILPNIVATVKLKSATGNL